MITIAAAFVSVVAAFAVVAVEILRRSSAHVILLRLASLLLATPGAILLFVAVLGAWHWTNVRTTTLLAGVGIAMIAAGFILDRLARRERARSGAARGFVVLPRRGQVGQRQA